MKLLEYNVFIEASSSAVFRVVADPRSKLAWVPAIRRVRLESDRPAHLGTKYLASSGVGPIEFTFHEQIVEWVENQRLAYEGRSPWGYFKSVATLQPKDTGTDVHYCMHFAPPGGFLGAVLGRIVGLFLHRPMEVKAAMQLKELVEKGLWKPAST